VRNVDIPFRESEKYWERNMESAPKWWRIWGEISIFAYSSDLVKLSHMWHDFREIWRSPLRSFPVTWLIHTRHDSYIHDMTYSYATWLIHTRHDSFTCDMMEGGLWRDFRIFSDLLEAEEFWWLCTSNFPGLQFVGWVLLPSFVREALKRIDFGNSKTTIDLYIAHIKSPSPFTCCHASIARPGVPSEGRIFRGLIQNHHNLGIVKVHLNLKSMFCAQF